MISILVLALNPSIDAEWRVDDVLWEEKNNVLSERRWAGGKGINVTRWLKHLGGRPQLLLPLGGRSGDELESYLRKEKISSHIIPLREATRVNVIVTTKARKQMRFNPPGPKLSRKQWRQVVKPVERYLDQLSRAEKATAIPLLILSGSLPRGLPATAYARLIRVAHRFKIKTLLDCDGAAFAAAAKARPFLVKPNEHELARWFGGPLKSESEIRSAAFSLSRQTRGWVLVSRGAKPALLVNAARKIEFKSNPPRVKPVNTVGAGDAMLAGVAHAISKGQSPDQWLDSGVRTGSRATQLPAGLVQQVTRI